jgi:hypothetical protein
MSLFSSFSPVSSKMNKLDKNHVERALSGSDYGEIPHSRAGPFRGNPRNRNQNRVGRIMSEQNVWEPSSKPRRLIEEIWR